MSEHEKRLVSDLKRHAASRPRFGYRRVHALLRADGWRVNHKQVCRLWKKEGLRVPSVKHKRTRLGCSENGILRRKAERMNHVWTYDFVMDRTEDGRRLKLLTVVDEYTRECLAIHVDRTIDGAGVIEVLKQIAASGGAGGGDGRGLPEFIRSDNGPEFIAKAVREWLEESKTGTLFIAPGSPWENAYIESFNGKLRDELLAGELLFTLAEARYLTERWRRDYNTRRPHSSLDYRTPAAFAGLLKSKDAKPLKNYVERGDEAPLPSQTHPSTPHEHSKTKAAAGAAAEADTMFRLS